MNKLILILSLLLFGGCKAKEGYKLYFEIERGSTDLNGWVEIEGVRHDIKIRGY